MADRLAEEFLSQYDEPAETPAPAPDPSADELEDLQDQLDDALADLAGVALDEEQREDQRGKRTPDLPDLMFETAEGLRDCPQILEVVDTAPETFEHVALKDLALGAVIQALQAAYRRADNGHLWSCAEAEEVMDEVEAQVDALLKSADLDPERRQLIELAFTDAMARRREAQQRSRGMAQADQVAMRAEHERLDDAKERELRAVHVRDFLRDTLAEQGEGTPQ